MSFTKRKLAIFDIDGTLTDSVKVHQAAFVDALHKFGLLHFDTNWSSYKHHTDTYIFKTIYENQFKKIVSEQDITLFEQYLFELISESLNVHELKEIKGAREFLLQLEQHDGFDIVFATGSLLAPAKLKLEKVGINTPQELIISANQIFSRDDLVLRAIDTAKEFYGRTEYEQIISFGDGLWDFQTAKNIQIDFIGIHNQKLLEYEVPEFYLNFYDLKLLSSIGMQEYVSEFPQFDIKSEGKISESFISKGIYNFRDAVEFIQNLPYGRNANKNELVSLFDDNCGTCSTKHALLKQLAEENDFKEIRLIVGLFKMNEKNTPEVDKTLKTHELEYIPEAHCYLRYKNQILDYTKQSSSPDDFISDLLEEIEIEPHLITDYKVNYHQEYLKSWLTSNAHIQKSLDEIWKIREQCIQDLASD